MLFISIVLLSMNVALGFTIENSLGEQTQFFSSNLDEVTLKSNSNTTTELYYMLLNSTNTTTLPLEECGNQYCTNFSLTNYTTYSNSVEIRQENTSSKVYLDDQKPQILNLTYNVDKENKTLTLKYKFKDNSNTTVNAQLFKKEGNDFVYEKNLTNTTQTSYDITTSQNTNFLIKIEDSVGNSYEESVLVEVDDIFKPKITSYKVISKEDGTFDLSFSLEDEELEEYKISQNNLFLSETISGDEFQTRVTLPFSQNEILLNITDANGNFQEQLISLESKISVSSFPKYSNDEKVEFTSNAKNCRLDILNGRVLSNSFDKSGNDFTQELSLRENQENTLTLYCERDNYAEYLSKEIIYDTQNPEDVELEVEIRDDGSLYLTWSSSEDNFDDVEYQIYRNNKKIDTTSKTSFKDTLVTYPNSYEYEIIPIDLAKNKGESNIVEKTPKKVSVDLSFSNKEQEKTTLNSTQISIQTERGVTLIQEVKQNGITKFSKEINATSSSMSLDFPLFLGANELSITARDEMGNTNTQSKFVIYEQEQQVVEEEITPPTSTTSPQEPTISPTINNTNTTSSAQESKTSSWNSWVWFLIFLVFLGIFLFAFVIDEDQLRKLSIRDPRKKAAHARKLKDDEILGKSLERTKQKRIQKQQELAEKKRKEAEKKKLQEQRKNSYQQKKHEELSKRPKTDFSIFPKNSSSKKVIEPKEKSPSLHSQKSQEKAQKTSLKEKLLSRNKSQPQEEKDPLSTYLQAKKSSGYNDTKSYRASYHEEQKRKQQEAEAKKLQEEQEAQYAKQLESKKQQEAEAKKKAEFTSKNNEKRSSKDKLSLDDYLNKRTKKKRFYFAEKEVERNLKARK